MRAAIKAIIPQIIIESKRFEGYRLSDDAIWRRK
jgi:hypothetical protein